MLGRRDDVAGFDGGLGADGVRYATSSHGDVIGFLFADPLVAPPGHTEYNNKIFWEVRRARLERAADSSPGEIHPSIVDVPSPGCWHFVLTWAGHRDEIDLLYQPAP